MIHHQIDLNLQETYPLARALTFTKGDHDGADLQIRFFHGKTAIGTDPGDYATLSVQFEGNEEAELFSLFRDENGMYTIPLGAHMLAQSGVVRCAASLYNQDGARLTIGRFTYVVQDDPSLPASGELTTRQVEFMQQLLSIIAVIYDQAQVLKDGLSSVTTHAKEMGDYAHEAAIIAEGVGESLTVTWLNLKNKPEVFPPAAHEHEALNELVSKDISVMQSRLFPANTSIQDFLRSAYDGKPSAGYALCLNVLGAPASQGVLWYTAASPGFATALFISGETVYMASLQGNSFSGWDMVIGKKAIVELELSLPANGWVKQGAETVQVLSVPGLRPGYPGSIGAVPGMGRAQRNALRGALMHVAKVEPDSITIGCDGSAPLVDIALQMIFIAGE